MHQRRIKSGISASSSVTCEFNANEEKENVYVVQYDIVKHSYQKLKNGWGWGEGGGDIHRLVGR